MNQCQLCYASIRQVVSETESAQNPCFVASDYTYRFAPHHDRQAIVNCRNFEQGIVQLEGARPPKTGIQYLKEWADNVK